MGRNRRFANPEDSPDVPALIEKARADLSEVNRRAPELWEHLYAPDVRHAAPKDAEGNDQAPEAKVRVQHMGHANWTHASRIQQTYMNVTAELARGHWELGQNTDVPDYWTYAGEVPVLTGERAHTVELPELLKWAGVLDESLAWLAEQELLPPEVNALMRAGEHIASARKHIEGLWRQGRQRMCGEPDCNPGGRPRPLVASDGKVCRACRKRKQREAEAEEKRRREELAGRRKAS